MEFITFILTASAAAFTFFAGRLLTSSPRRLLVLGMPQSGKTTLLNILRDETSRKSVATHSLKTIEQCKIKFKNKEITLGKTLDIPGDFSAQKTALEKDVKNFFKEKNGLILYMINCNDLESKNLLDYTCLILRKALDAYANAKVAIIYSHPDEARVNEDSLNKIHKDFSDKLKEADWDELADDFLKIKHYMINLIGKDAKEHLEKVFKDCE